MNAPRDRRGMTLIELLIVVVLGALVLAAMYETLVQSQRTYAAQSAQAQGQQTLRAGTEILFSELREISPADDDIVDMDETSLTIRAAREIGIVCVTPGASGPDPTVRALRVGRYLRGDSAQVFFENDPNLEGDDVWRTAMLTNLDTTGSLTCPNAATAQEVTLQGVSFGSVAARDSITPGAPIRNFQRYTYALGTYDGEPYLLRTDATGATAPVLGPLKDTDGVTFRYLDGAGAVTTDPTAVRQIEVTLRASSQVLSGTGGPQYRDSLVTRVFTRNTTTTN